MTEQVSMSISTSRQVFLQTFFVKSIIYILPKVKNVNNFLVSGNKPARNLVRQDQSGTQAFQVGASLPLLGGQFSKSQFMQMSEILGATQHHGSFVSNNNYRYTKYSDASLILLNHLFIFIFTFYLFITLSYHTNSPMGKLLA